MAVRSHFLSSWTRSRSCAHRRSSLASDVSFGELLSSMAGRLGKSATTAPWYRMVTTTRQRPAQVRTSCMVGVTTSAGGASRRATSSWSGRRLVDQLCDTVDRRGLARCVVGFARSYSQVSPVGGPQDHAHGVGRLHRLRRGHVVRAHDGVVQPLAGSVAEPSRRRGPLGAASAAATGGSGCARAGRARARPPWLPRPSSSQAQQPEAARCARGDVPRRGLRLDGHAATSQPVGVAPGAAQRQRLARPPVDHRLDVVVPPGARRIDGDRERLGAPIPQRPHQRPQDPLVPKVVRPTLWARPTRP